MLGLMRDEGGGGGIGRAAGGNQPVAARQTCRQRAGEAVARAMGGAHGDRDGGDGDGRPAQRRDDKTFAAERDDNGAGCGRIRGQCGKDIFAAGDRASQQRLRLDPVTLDDTELYLRYRLKLAGCERELFAREAAALIHEASAGAHREIDRLASLALREAARKKRKLVEVDLLRLLLDREARAA